ncbi:hypothetical protein EG830_05405 [bacterium]|nr:hypothetical protein [bacterium]
MKTLKYILILVLSLGAFNSCLVDDTTRYDLNDDGPNLAGFTDARTSFSFISDGNEYEFTVKMKLIGPTSMDVTEDIVVTIAEDASSTAIKGTHFRLDQPTITLKKSDNYLGLMPITILTEGITAPLEEAPVLVLKVVSATGAENVLNNGKKLEITLNYGCFSNLAGTYNAHLIRTNADGTQLVYDYVDEITQTGVGEYRTTEVAHYIGGLGVGTPGYTFLDVCNVITVPNQNLVDYYSNEVFGHLPGSVDPATGVIKTYYTVTFAAGNRTYETTYTPIP